ncbi:hypothetical protein ACMGE7_02090 [Macrococcus equi]|uniref:hypothetical protein n=1 Tax=Macrococcus equi TaxID=3395462 RepID=UPI0039BDAF25
MTWSIFSTFTIVIIFAINLILTGCGSKNEKSTTNETNKKQTKSEKVTSEKPTTEAVTTESATSELVTTEQPSTEISSTKQYPTKTSYINPNNIQNQQQLETIIYSNTYSENEKNIAYQNAVDKGIIPMAPATELYAAERYRDSVNMQNGLTEKDVMRQKYESWIEDGTFTEEQMDEELAKFDY